MESMGKLSYWWHGSRRRAVVQQIVRDGMWRGSHEPWGGLGAGQGGGSGVWVWAGVAVGVAGVVVVGVAARAASRQR